MVQPQQAIHTVHVMLAKAQIDLKCFLHEELTGPAGGPFECAIHAMNVHIASGCGSSKPEARKNAYCKLCHEKSEQLEQLIDEFRRAGSLTQAAAPPLCTQSLH